ncbi:hypothetical protein JJJ17_03360 [Paracoccus caeni]|uniref:Peptidoglycan binding domain-containing protein n=1 Tax=Paracoccus caeni TaxID=657651 RepID=A0A934SCS5_9RHOB|nr:hypothetical protein [Paracoccus caeni]MBK4214960.1 hypothetical protein [Paracoccus caeni]
MLSRPARPLFTSFSRAMAVAVAGYLVAVAPVSAKAQDVLVLDDPLPAELAERIEGAGVLRGTDPLPAAPLVYGGQAGAGVAEALAELPAAALVVFTDCAAGDSLTNLKGISARIAVPAEGSCDATALGESFAEAATLPPSERLAALQRGGYRMLPANAAATPAAGTGGLVISAMPIETLRPVEGSGTIVLANLGETPFEARPAAVPSASGVQPSRPGLPQPSIIIGDLAVLSTTGEPGPLGMAYAARETIRQRDPAMFERLVSQGAFDPSEDQIAAAIQTELLRMGCYRGTVDGDWGGGSASALARYAETGGASGLSGADPDIALFRAVIRADEVACPAPVAPRPVAAVNDPPRGPRASRGDVPVQPRRDPTPPPAETAPVDRRINTGPSGLSGVFR